MSEFPKVFHEILKERQRQIDLNIGGNTAVFDDQNTINDWVAIICAYLGKTGTRVIMNLSETNQSRDNFIKIAALAIAAVESLDRKA